jgi:hypothetical protein
MEVPPEDHRWPEFRSGGRSPLVPIQRVLLLLLEGGVETECALGPHGFGWAGSTRCTLFLTAGGMSRGLDARPALFHPAACFHSRRRAGLRSVSFSPLVRFARFLAEKMSRIQSGQLNFYLALIGPCRW